MVFCRVQVVANIAAVLSSLSRFFATIMLGMCHVGMIQPDQLADTFQYGKLRLNGADNACDMFSRNQYRGSHTLSCLEQAQVSQQALSCRRLL